MKQIAFLLVVVATAAGVAVSLAHASGQASEAASPIYGVTIPPGYQPNIEEAYHTQESATN
jgi:hypothetical protein